MENSKGEVIGILAPVAKRFESGYRFGHRPTIHCHPVATVPRYAIVVPMPRIARLLAPLCLPLTLMVGAAQANAPPPATTGVTAFDLRVATLGEELAFAARGLCARSVFRTGIDLHSRAQYGRLTNEQARTMFPVTNGVAILLVVPGSTAQQSDIRSGDGLVAIDGTPLPLTPPGRRPDYAPTRQALDLLDAAMADGQASLSLRRADGSARQIVVRGISACPTRFQMAPGGGLEAEADGTYVKIGEAMVEAAPEDDVLAASIAHELAHNILRHRERQNAAGMRRGLARMFGRNAALSRAAEGEADRLVPWLLARAGYNPQAALRWLDLLERRIGPPAPTHPGWARRQQIISDQLPLIAAQIDEGRGILPPFDTINTGPLVPEGD